MPNQIKMIFWSDFTQLVRMVILILGALLPIVNPLGEAPIFLRMMPRCDEATRVILAGRIALYSLFFVLGSLLIGSFLLVRPSAFITLCIGVRICWDGIKALLAGIGVHA
jgi:small neutral amino acid transporter SnatA (MarC family)